MCLIQYPPPTFEVFSLFMTWQWRCPVSTRSVLVLPLWPKQNHLPQGTLSLTGFNTQFQRKYSQAHPLLLPKLTGRLSLTIWDSGIAPDNQVFMGEVHQGKFSCIKSSSMPASLCTCPVKFHMYTLIGGGPFASECIFIEQTRSLAGGPWGLLDFVPSGAHI